MSWALQVCTATASTGACFWCLRILAPLADGAGCHGTSGAPGPWWSRHRSGEWPGQVDAWGAAIGAAAPEEVLRARGGEDSSQEAPAAVSPLPLSPRVSVPLSVLDPPHRYRIHRRKSFDASDTLALPRVSSHGGLVGDGMRMGWGWGCLCLAQVPRWSLRPRESQDWPTPHSQAGLKENEELRLGHFHHLYPLAP